MVACSLRHAGASPEQCGIVNRRGSEDEPQERQTMKGFERKGGGHVI